MTPAEASKAIENVRKKRPSHVHLRVVGSIENPEGDGPGAKLQAARRAMSLSVNQVAEALKLRPEQVAAMESMHFAKLPGLGFALGYVRAYAELVDIDDVKSLVDDFREIWAPKQKHNEDVHSKQKTSNFALPLGILAIIGLFAWLFISAMAQSFIPHKKEEISSPDEAIKTWVQSNPNAIGRSMVEIEPLVSIKAIRKTRIILRGQDGALVSDKYLDQGQSMSADGLGRFIISADDGGALIVSGYGLNVPVGENYIAVDRWRVPDLEIMAKQKAEEEAKKELEENQKKLDENPSVIR